MGVNDIQKLLSQYVAGEIEYSRFREHCIRVYSEAAKNGQTEVLDLCRMIEWIAAEYSNDEISESELKHSLAQTVLAGRSTRNQVVGFVGYVAEVTVGSDNGATVIASATESGNNSASNMNGFSTSNVRIPQFELAAATT